MRLKFALVLVAAVALVVCSEASSLRQGSVTKSVASTDAIDSEERYFRVARPLRPPRPAAVPVSRSTWEKVKIALNRAARKVIPGTID
ncbi:hypothetical protein PRNP1_012033 [Phytophthora ramorum]